MASDQVQGGGESPSNVSLEKVQARKSRSKLIVVGSILALISIIAAAVAAGIVVSNNSKKNKGGVNTGPGISNSTSKDPNPKTPPPPTDPNSPSNFPKDPRLKRSFYGLAYTPEGSLIPNCGSTLPQIIQDIQLMSQLTKRLRLYGADCNQSALVLEAIKQTKVDMTVYLGNYVLPNDTETYARQRDNIKAAIETYGVDHIEGVTVGNEYMLNYLTDHGSEDPNSAVGDAGAVDLISYIQDTRTMLAGMNLPKKIPVGNSDAGYYFNNLVLQAIDYGLANVHAWFAHVTVDTAATWTYESFQEQNVQVASRLPNNPTMYIAEAGWPTQSSDLEHATNGASAASIANLQIFLDTFVCQANKNGTGYFYFEFFDEKWKDDLYGGVEGWWGLFNRNRTLKEITIPDCLAP